MFYEDRAENALRFGDVVRGFVLSAPNIDTPSAQEVKREYEIKVKRPEFAVVMSPCCSIGDKTIALTPLIEVKWEFFLNPYVAEDLTRVNRPMTPRQAVSPSIWDRMSEEERARRLDFGKASSYAYSDSFVYAPHTLLKKYPVKGKGVETETGYYMIDFRRIYRVECRQISSAKQAPLEVKLLQLRIRARSELRDKLAWYFGRPSPEDEI